MSKSRNLTIATSMGDVLGICKKLCVLVNQDILRVLQKSDIFQLNVKLTKTVKTHAQPIKCAMKTNVQVYKYVGQLPLFFQKYFHQK